MSELIVFNTRIPKKLKKELKILSASEEKSIQELVTLFIRDGIDNYYQKEK